MIPPRKGRALRKITSYLRAFSFSWYYTSKPGHALTSTVLHVFEVVLQLRRKRNLQNVHQIDVVKHLPLYRFPIGDINPFKKKTKWKFSIFSSIAIVTNHISPPSIKRRIHRTSVTTDYWIFHWKTSLDVCGAVRFCWKDQLMKEDVLDKCCHLCTAVKTDFNDILRGALSSSYIDQNTPRKGLGL